MDEFGCDYDCRTVGESINKYQIPDDWLAELDVYDGTHPFTCMPVERVRKSPALMALKLRRVLNRDEEYAGCIVLTDEKTIAFKIDKMDDFTKALRKEESYKVLRLLP